MKYDLQGKFARLSLACTPNCPLRSSKLLCCGITLIELLIAISIVAILAATALPSMTYWQAKNAADTTTHILFQQLQAAREFAINQGSAVSLCGINTHGKCSPNNIIALQIFIDSNKNKHQDNHEMLLAQTTLPNRGELTLNAHTAIRMKADGSSNTPASFIYCPSIPEASLIRKITISFSGRSYIAQDPTTSTSACSGF
ncbi:GspH/FimT family pseudopilin [Marinagarivorans cellulosilyticus]|uniref:Type II secretion system protein H n=1 Tax=Marinagarivorans cellulosilyticus TaxID=2721545 RepID=A0AAN1WFZ6_9GAMM|nr:GspH/FimT family pseudopilin [Marinagarivorans cellulosilyticus]BCD96907.1 type IV fimbrial biogenesis protein FimT [Marinagarivorans cellulosilyticus]